MQGFSEALRSLSLLGVLVAKGLPGPGSLGEAVRGRGLATQDAVRAAFARLQVLDADAAALIVQRKVFRSLRVVDCFIGLLALCLGIPMLMVFWTRFNLAPPCFARNSRHDGLWQKCKTVENRA